MNLTPDSFVFKYLSDFNGFTKNIIIFIAEAVILVFFFALIFFLVNFLFKKFEKLTFIKSFENITSSIKANIRLILVFFFISILMCLIGFNSFLIYKKIDISTYLNQWLLLMPKDFLYTMFFKTIKFIGLIVVANLLILIIAYFIRKLEKNAKAYEQIRANDKSIEKFFTSLNNIQSDTIWFLLFYIGAKMFPFPDIVPLTIFILLKIYLIIAFGFIIVRAVTAIIDSLDALSKKYSKKGPVLSVYSDLKFLVPFFSRCIEYIIYVTVASLVLLQVEYFSKFANYGAILVKIIGIFFLSRVGLALSEIFLDKSFIHKENATDEEKQKRLTLIPLVKSFLKYLIYFIALILTMRTMRISPTTVLAGAGIIGLVIGLGAQPLINDLVSGFFILFENIYLVGDFIETSSARGIVEGIDIRTSRIRDPNGQLHILRNGQLNEVINYSKGYTFAVVEVGVAYDSDLDKVYSVLSEVGNQLKAQNKSVIEPTVVQGLEDFGESELLVRTTTRVKPGTHLSVSRHLRKLIKEAFDDEGIEIPFSRRVLILKNMPESKIPDELKPS